MRAPPAITKVTLSDLMLDSSRFLNCFFSLRYHFTKHLTSTLIQFESTLNEDALVTEGICVYLCVGGGENWGH